jgi:hypothetical protein
MSLVTDFLARPAQLSAASKYTALNGVAYLGMGALLAAWPGVAQTLLMERAFVGQEDALFRVIGLTTMVIGWLYLFGGCSGSRQFVAATIIHRLIFVPLVFAPLIVAGVFPHVLLAFAILDPLLAIGAWTLLARKT